MNSMAVKGASNPMLVVASEKELPATHRVWGTGGWLPPEQREALDWLTLARLLGWGVTVTRETRLSLGTRLPGGCRWVVVAVDPDSLEEGLVAQLASRLAAEPILVVARAAAPDSPLARLAGVARRAEHITGRSLRWIGPGQARDWRCRNILQSSALKLSQGASVWATFDGAPLIVARRVGQGLVATVGLHPSAARDADGMATSLLTHLLIWGSPAPVAWLSWEGTLVLRMDDAGGAQNVHSCDWSYPKLGQPEWASIGADLSRRNGRLSIGYTAGWVDDGDVERGILEVGGRSPRRVPGRVYQTPLVRYQDRMGHAPGTFHDYRAEFRGIEHLRAAGLGDVELHGYTHMHPHTATWAQAPDRYEGSSAAAWYRELGKSATAAIAARPPDEHPLALGMRALEQHFAVRPTTLICPGDEWTNQTLERALDLGLHLVISYYLALRDADRFCWTQHVCAPYLDEAHSSWFDAGLPVIGYFHDRDLALEGVDWLTNQLDRWQAARARRLIDLRELAAAVGSRLSLEQRDSGLCLTVTGGNAPALVRPLPVNISIPGGRLPARLSVSHADRHLSLPVDQLGESVGRVVLPP
jgi:hypothetical protein